MVYKRKRVRPAVYALLGLGILFFVVVLTRPMRIDTGMGRYGIAAPPMEHELLSMPRRIIFGIMGGGLLVGGATALARSRHPIIIDDDGLGDRAAFPEKIRWPAVENVQMVGSEKKGYRIEVLAGGRGRFIEVGDVDATPGSVFQEIFETWNKNKKRG